MTDVTFDETDFEILQRLDRDGDIEVDKLSEELDVSESTIYYRMQNYREKGIIRNRATELDPEQLGLDMKVITEIDADYDGPGYEIVAEKISSLSGVQSVYFMLGEMSFYVISRVLDHDHLQELMEEIIQTDGVKDSTTNVVLRTFKDQERLLTNYSEEDMKQIFNIKSSDE